MQILGKLQAMMEAFDERSERSDAMAIKENSPGFVAPDRTSRLTFPNVWGNGTATLFAKDQVKKKESQELHG